MPMMTDQQLHDLTSLEKILVWMAANRLNVACLDLIAQDEFSYDLIMPLPEDEQFVVFGVT